jgi:hypothetical protein
LEELLEPQPLAPGTGAPRTVPVRAPVVPIDERAARRSLRQQIAQLERRLCDAFVTAYPHASLPPTPAPARGGPRMLSLGELERVRDDLAERLKRAGAAISERAQAEEHNRQLLERMLLDPRRYKYVRLERADCGTPGCGHYHVRPRLGLIGILMGWWQVKLSSGCPLARGPRRAPRSRNPLASGTAHPQAVRVRRRAPHPAA